MSTTKASQITDPKLLELLGFRTRIIKDAETNEVYGKINIISGTFRNNLMIMEDSNPEEAFTDDNKMKLPMLPLTKTVERQIENKERFSLKNFVDGCTLSLGMLAIKIDSKIIKESHEITFEDSEEIEDLTVVINNTLGHENNNSINRTSLILQRLEKLTTFGSKASTDIRFFYVDTIKNIKDIDRRFENSKYSEYDEIQTGITWKILVFPILQVNFQPPLLYNESVTIGKDYRIKVKAGWDKLNENLPYDAYTLPTHCFSIKKYNSDTGSEYTKQTQIAVIGIVPNKNHLYVHSEKIDLRPFNYKRGYYLWGLCQY